ncbi:MAG: F0F1 ATP synthase subunit A [Bacillota bacterium]|jgi:F-type H+-transporting ATPase subunit a
MNAVLQLASEGSFLLGGDAMWETSKIGFNFSFAPGLTKWMIVFWGVMLFMIVAGVIGVRKKALVPTGWQNFSEWAVGGLTNFFTKMIGPKLTKTFGPMLVTFFIFILLSNYSGMLPLNFSTEEGTLSLSNLQAPTSVFSVTAGFALIVFCCVHFAGFRENKLGYFKHLISPVVIMLPFSIIDEIVHPFTLALRLFGNIHGEETVVEQLGTLSVVTSGWVPACMEILGVLFGLIQALIFSLLAAIYISEAAEHE